MADYSITVNGKEIVLSKTDLEALDSIEMGHDSFHVLANATSYKVDIAHEDVSNKNFRLLINGNSYEVQLQDSYDRQVKKMGLLAVSSKKINSIKAPMPGLIIDVLVEKGQEIEEGTPLLVLSAMKMENIILSQGEGKVKAVLVNKEDAVEKGQLIIEME